MKKVFMFFWRLPKKIYCKINECEENFLQKFDAEYKSKLAMHSLIFHFASMVLNALLVVFYLLYPNTFDGIIANYNINMAIVTVLALVPTIILTTTYIALYLKKRVPIIEGRKWIYCVQVILTFLFGGAITLAPIYILLGLLALSIYVVIFIICLYILLAFVSIALGGGSSSGRNKRKWTLSNGDEVTEEKGLCGESYYTGNSGTSYDTNDGGNTFYEK